MGTLTIQLYISKLLYPLKLTFIYPRWNPSEFSLWGLVWPGLTICITLALWFWKKTIGQAPLVAWIGFLVSLFPALGFFDVYAFRYSFVADHWQYLASIFSIALLVGTGHGLYKRFCGARLAQSVVSLAGLLPVVIVLVLLMGLTRTRATIYENPERLWLDTIDKNPKAWMAWSNLGCVYARVSDYEKAIEAFEQAIRINPNDFQAHRNLVLHDF